MWRVLGLSKLRFYTLSVLGLVLCIGAAALGYWIIISPTTLVIAVAPRDGAEAQLVEGFRQALAERRRDIRLKPVLFDDVLQSAEALAAGRADLAIVRPDVRLPANGLTVAILREEAVVFVAPSAGKIKDVAGLAGKRLGVVARHQADLSAVTAVLAHYDLSPPALAFVPLQPSEVQEALKARRIDALAFVAAPTSREASELTRLALRASNDKIEVIAVEESEALALKTPALTEVTIPPGSLGGRPKQPGEEVKTVAVSYRLMARADKDRVVVSRVAQYLFQMRSRIAQGAPAINLMKAPDTDNATSAALPNHPGAVDYFSREQLSFMDRYGDLIWLGLFAGGGLSSGLAWVQQLFVRKRREITDEVLDRLLCILSEVRSASTLAELDALAREIDNLVTHAIRHTRRRAVSRRVMGALTMAIEATRAALHERRRELLGHDPRSPDDGAGEGTEPPVAARPAG